MTVLENDKYFSIGWDSKFDDKYLDVNNKVFERVKFEINTKKSWQILEALFVLKISYET